MRVQTYISNLDDDLIENADGEPIGVSGPDLGCLDCHEDVETIHGGTPWLGTVECRECGQCLAEEYSVFEI